MDILASIASDPTTLPLWAVFLFAASMYPLGMLFGCRACCEPCVSCCRDEVGQITVEYSLEGGGGNLPYASFNYPDASWISWMQPESNPDGFMYPMFRLTGDESGATMYVGSSNFGLGPNRVTLGATSVANGNDDWLAPALPVPAEFTVGETVSVTPIPAANVITPADLTVSAGSCDNPQGFSLSGTPGEWETLPDLIADRSITCNSDSGTMVFDFPSTLKQPVAPCESCELSVQRSTFHPLNARIPGTVTSPFGEQTSFAVGVYFSSQDPDILCSSNVGIYPKVVIAHRWQSATFNTCQKTTSYTINTDEQDCAPFEGWDEQVESVGDGPNGFERQLITLTATADYGSGFSGRALEPSGVPGVDDGPLASVEVINGGSGYAVLGRVEPEVDLSFGSGSGAAFEVVWAEAADDAYGRPRWTIDSVTVTDGGEGYDDLGLGYVVATYPNVQQSSAYLTCRVGRVEPEVVMNSNNGSGATFTATFTERSGAAPNWWKYWTIDDITLNDGGAGYVDGETVTFSGATSDDVNGIWSAEAIVHVSRSQPTLTLFGGTGTSAVLAVVLAQLGSDPDTWGIDAVTITDGGAGYEVDDVLSVDLAAGDVEVAPATVTVGSVDGSGAITGISIPGSGEYYNTDGGIASLTLGDGIANGELQRFYRVTGVIEYVDIAANNGGGLYYQESTEIPGIVSDITIHINQVSPSAGSGAEISAVVDDDAASPTFGQITALTIDNGGSAYLARWVEDGACVGPGGKYQYAINLGLGSGLIAEFGPFERICGDYEVTVTIEPAES